MCSFNSITFQLPGVCKVPVVDERFLLTAQLPYWPSFHGKFLHEKKHEDEVFCGI